MVFLSCLVLWIGGDAVKHVTNGLVPEQDPLALRLIEQWRVVPEQDARDELIWVGPNITLDVDSRGHVFVLDDRENRIVELDNSGSLVQVIGGKGQGPGEFTALTRLQVFPDGLVAFERQDGTAVLNHFDANYQFQKRQRLPSSGVVLDVILSPDKQLLSSEILLIDPSGKRTKKRWVTDPEWHQVVEVFVTGSPSLDRGKLFNPNYWSEFLAEIFKPFARGDHGFAVFSPKGEIFSAVGHTYQITRWSSSGEKTLIVEKEYKKMPLTEKEIAAIVEPIRDRLMGQLPLEIQQIITEKVVQTGVEKAEFPRYKNPIFNLSFTDGGELMVIHDFNWFDGTAVADFFDREGQYLGGLKHPRFGLFSGFVKRMVVKNGFAYTIETVDGMNQAVCYRIEGKL